MNELYNKKLRLEEILRGYGAAAVAFSAGVDSTYLLKAAHDILGNKAIAVTAESPLVPEEETAEARRFCAENGIEQVTFTYDPFAVSGFRGNPPDRCYICKKAIFGRIAQIAAGRGITHIAEGSNADDTGDYRPGMKAVMELGISSPLLEAGLSKADIRGLSREAGLPTWDKPSFACLASRFVYGETMTLEKLKTVEKAERKLHELGFRQVRVRMHGDLARIETLQSDITKLVRPDTARDINRYLGELGFSYVTLDLGGYKTGSMNKGLAEVDKKEKMM